MTTTNTNHVIDCDATPSYLDWLIIVEHRKSGQLQWNPENILLYKTRGLYYKASGNEFRIELKDQPVLNACVLEYLMAHAELIPEEWKNKAISFFGTIYADADGHRVVRYLCWNGYRWCSDHRWLPLLFNETWPAAILKQD